MSSIQERLQQKRVPLDVWNIREQLCLASAVVRSGDQNWMSVSRSLKTIGEPNRPADWYSQKSCAAQYGALLEHVETPKRKKRSSEGVVETPQESILKRLTQERITEIQNTLQEMNQQYEQIKNEVAEVRSQATTEERLKEIWAGIEAAKRAREREAARRAAWLKEREEKRARAEKAWRPNQSPGATTPTTPTAPSSPLLTSLLKSSPVVTTPQHMSHPANVIDTVSPSAGAPTLSMLLEKAGGVTVHDNKQAAIEHIKNELVQIEQQLKASTTPPPAPLLPPAPIVLGPPPAVDIDDIEIKAEDVYAFREVDIPIPPVTTMHKANTRGLDKSPVKTDELQAGSLIHADAIAAALHDDGIKMQPLDTTPVMAIEPTVLEVSQPQEIESVLEPLSSQPAIEPPAAMEVTPQPANISFPEVKFPVPEIKVIHSDVLPEEDIRESDTTPDLSFESAQPDEALVAVTEPLPNIAEISERLEESALPTCDIVPADTEAVVQEHASIPCTDQQEPINHVIKPEPVLDEEPPVPLELDVTQTVAVQEAEKQKVDNEQQAQVDVESVEDIKKDNDAQDSLPLKEMMQEEKREESLQQELIAEVKEEKPSEPDETHTETDDDTPMEVIREEDGKKKRDYSRKKKPESRTYSGSESAAEASAPESPFSSDSDKNFRQWKKSIMMVYSRLCAHKYASLFLRPITDEEAPGYSAIVKRPMDLSNIKKNVEAGNIRTTSEFHHAILLMLNNALMYNSSEHSVYHMTKAMFEEAKSQMGFLLAAQAHADLVQSETPQRRKRRHADSTSSQPSAKRTLH